MNKSWSRHILVLVGPFLLLAACGTTEWVNTQNPKANFAQDYNACENQIRQDPKTQVGNKLLLDRAIDRCITKMGWVQRETR